MFLVTAHVPCPVFQSRCASKNSWFSRDVRKKLKLKVLSFHLYQVKAIFKAICFQLGGPLCFENRTRFFSQCVTSPLSLGNMLRAWKHRFALCFRVLSNQYVERSAYAKKFSRENERFEIGKLNSRCFHWLPAAEGCPIYPHRVESSKGVIDSTFFKSIHERLSVKHSNFV